MSKFCYTCNTHKDLLEFYECARTKDGRTFACRGCMKALATKYRKEFPDKARSATMKWEMKNKRKRTIRERVLCLRRYYGMTVEEFDQRVLDQAGLCAVCGDPLMYTGMGRLRACVDHNHTTGKVRGIIHGSCNSMIGYAADSPKKLRQAAEYLEKFI